MIGIKLETAKKGFFDRPAVAAAVDRSARKALSKFGAFVRRRARSSIRKRRASSPAGSPPSSHEGSLRQIFFVYEPETRGVVIGPVKLNMRGSVPQVLEYGGTVQKRTRFGVEIKRYAGNPFMRPAFELEKAQAAKQFGATFKNS